MLWIQVLIGACKELLLMPQQKPKTFNNALSRRIISTPGPAAKNTFFYMQETGCLKAEDAAVTHRQDLESFLIVAAIFRNSRRNESDSGHEK